MLLWESKLGVERLTIASDVYLQGLLPAHGLLTVFPVGQGAIINIRRLYGTAKLVRSLSAVLVAWCMGPAVVAEMPLLPNCCSCCLPGRRSAQLISGACQQHMHTIGFVNASLLVSPSQCHGVAGMNVSFDFSELCSPEKVRSVHVSVDVLQTGLMLKRRKQRKAQDVMKQAGS